jgi:CubicO group peptidase (beta-lactamase class C family)
MGQPSSLSYANKVESQLNIPLIKSKVDSIMERSINERAFPGAQLLVVHKGQIIFHEAYGFHTYDNLQQVELDDLYDLASVTKITGPLPALMKLYEEGKLDLDAPFSSYWPAWKNKRDKKNITLRELLAHQSGFKPYITFIKRVVSKKGRIKRRFIKSQPSERYSTKVYKSIYLNYRFKKKMFRQIKRSKVSNKKTYLYSGIASLIYPEVIEDIVGQDYQTYIKNTFFDPLGCSTLGYNPFSKKFKNNIVPTEIDTFFRKELVKNYVHDENAALLGGVSGNAGLFSGAKDLAIYMQMLLQKGEYNGKRFLKKSTVEEFIRVQYPENNNRRGLGFDKPIIGNDTLILNEAYPAPKASGESFGHSGFTGTLVWADPKYDMVFVFLSNRVHPFRTHRKIYTLNVRPSLMNVFYEAILKERGIGK